MVSPKGTRAEECGAGVCGLNGLAGVLSPVADFGYRPGKLRLHPSANTFTRLCCLGFPGCWTALAEGLPAAGTGLVCN